MVEKLSAVEYEVIQTGKMEIAEEDRLVAGREITVLAIRKPIINGTGNTLGLLGVLWDITEDKRLKITQERRIHELEGALSERVGQVESLRNELEAASVQHRQKEGEFSRLRNELESGLAALREEIRDATADFGRKEEEFTRLRTDGVRSRPWVMSRGDWIGANLGGLQRLLEPLARRLVPEGSPRSNLRRKTLGAQIGGLLGYVSKKVLGQYDAFLPPDDEGLIQQEFLKNLPFALDVAKSAADPAHPISHLGNTVKPFYLELSSIEPELSGNPQGDFRFAVSYGDPQTVQVLAARSLGQVTLKYQVNGGAVQNAPTAEWNGGERFGGLGDVYYHIMRGQVTGTQPGDSVKVWFEGGGQVSDSFSYTAKVESQHRNRNGQAMETRNAPPHPENVTESLPQLMCPICAGLLILLRGFFRCTRCGCHFCESCDPTSESEA